MKHILPEGHEKALKQAFYNTAALVFVFLVAGATIAVYHILEAFIRPLLWAVLCGTFLHPFKNTLTRTLQAWLRGLRNSGTPLAVGAVMLPIKVIDSASETLGSILMAHLKLIIAFSVGLPTVYILYYFGPLVKILGIIQSLFFFTYELIGYLSTIWVLTLILGYILVVIFYWTPQSSPFLKHLAVPVWIALLLQIITLAGPLRVPLFIILVTMLIVGFLAEMKARRTSTVTSPDAPDPSEASPWALFFGVQTTPEASPSEDVTRTPSAESSNDGKKPPETLGHTGRPKVEKPSKAKRSLSDNCFIALFWALVLVRVWINFWVIQLLPALLIFLFIKRLGMLSHVGGIAFIKEKMGPHLMKARTWLEERRDAFAPSPIQGMAKMVIRGDRKIVAFLEDSLDSVMSIVIILALLLGAIMCGMFVCVQVHQETVHLLTVTSNVANKTLHPDVNKWMPKGDDMQKALDTMIENAYVYGREYIASKQNPSVDGIFHMMNQTQNLPSVDNRNLALTNWSSLWESMNKLEEFNYETIMSFVQENIGTFMAALESVWLVLKSNISLALNVVTAIISLLFGGGTALLNFVLGVIIFLSTLFYLLASSGDRYKPMDWIMRMVPSDGSPAANSFGLAVEGAISGVFMASFKMAAFYGLYTWLMHTIFDINIVFIPSALAALFGAIPFLGTYWAALPAVIELWIVQGLGLKAVLLLLCHFLPMCFVDTAIYSDIRGGGHPYLTGLAIAGGLYWMGLEGAIIGPILLCSLIVAFNVYGNMVSPEDSGAKSKSSVVRALKEDRRVTFNLQRRESCPAPEQSEQFVRRYLWFS
ncbi:transmembrane protein 245-like isoform X10 [Lineus longissimus]|uniref:transmembrane protein 245-like isoform X10 n=1 Tax=Lineus longissimus TaxID=88925 RepID=UPI00315DFBA9